jgi:uncharacterized phage-associated protein
MAMQPNISKIVESVLFLVNEAHRRSMAVSQYDIVKSVFIADRAHLNRYGRPITYDNYVAMKYGPVPSTVYNFLKETGAAFKAYGQALPWQRSIDGNKIYFEKPKREHDDDVLSPSDVGELTKALTLVKTLGFKNVVELTHRDKAYLDAWNDENPDSSYPMNYALLFTVPNEEKAEELAFLSQHA